MDEDVVSLRADERSSIQGQSNFIAYETASVATIGWQYYAAGKLQSGNRFIYRDG